MDGSYPTSLLGLANIIELLLLGGGFISVCIASTGWAQLVDLISKNSTTQSDQTVFYDVDAYSVKQADQAILMIIFGLTLFTFLAHILLGLRNKFSWRRISVGLGLLCILYSLCLFGISVVVACWEDKLRRIMTSTYLGNQFWPTPNGIVKPQTGAAAAAATFGFAASVLFLGESLIRFRKLGDKSNT
ncbi:unnamed protein product [Didymodactylos carnosus]|uniref:MARVEL domain-containing protein n=1 Tax=Didymodactylos carnosus TaxID=1234261 RepID=A0A813NKF8_9BILA|nr:unnamed protein product [Didymodactylos carnosus]CAF1148977.1 unnamed protein product [Didymodactylos carnosus]CAF3514444.1 unnamed protein product [Didymodactylos carnosus]CAF3953321.1 unnamed protein product [Didymodactylos carnosus]